MTKGAQKVLPECEVDVRSEALLKAEKTLRNLRSLLGRVDLPSWADAKLMDLATQFIKTVADTRKQIESGTEPPIRESSNGQSEGTAGDPFGAE